MADDRQLPQRFSEKEVTAILRRAVELQAAGRDERRPGSRRGETSLDQLRRQAAAELGLAPQLVDQAALEVADAGAPAGRSWLWGGPWNVDHDRLVAGAVGEEDWPALLA